MKKVYIIVKNTMREIWVNGKEVNCKKNHEVLEQYINLGGEIKSHIQTAVYGGIYSSWTIVV